MLFAKNNIQIVTRDNLLPIDQGELWRNLDSWRSEARGESVATVIGRIFVPRPSWFDPRTYLPKSQGFRPETATTHELFKRGVYHYLEHSGIAHQNATIETGLRVSNRGSTDRKPWRVDCPRATTPVLRFLLTHGGASPAHFALGELRDDELDKASNFLHPEQIGTKKLEELIPEPGEIVMFLGHVTLYERPGGRGWGETHDATVWLHSRPPALAC